MTGSTEVIVGLQDAGKHVLTVLSVRDPNYLMFGWRIRSRIE
jgi:hypothetical protein